MEYLALTLPGFSPSPIPTPPGLKGEFVNLASFLSGLLNITFYLATFLAFYWLTWGAFQYILAKGNKEDLAKARAKITWALIGLMVIFLAYFIAKFTGEIFPPRLGPGAPPIPGGGVPF